MTRPGAAAELARPHAPVLRRYRACACACAWAWAWAGLTKEACRVEQ
jgi:hypothetical protein